MTQQRIKPAYAKFDPAHVFDGLFVPTKGKKRGRLYVPPRRFGDSEISFQGFEQLGADDQSILLAVSAQLGIDGLMIEAKPPGEIGQQLRLALDFDNDDGRPLKTKKTSLRSLLIDAGYDGPESGAALARIKESLNRMGNAQIGVVCGRGRNPTLRLWPTIFSGKIDVFPGDRRSRLISSMTSVAPA